MLKLTGKILGIPIERIWFWSGESLENKAQIIRLVRAESAEVDKLDKRYEATEVYTLVSDLKEDREELWAKLNKNYKYEINRAYKENISINFYNSNAIKEKKILDDFRKTYMSFSKQLGIKSVEKAYDEEKIHSYIDNDCILISVAILDNAIVYHLYVYDGLNTVLCYSASDVREEGVDRSLVGRMNKLLHWEDMLYFKGKGIEKFDWGNVSTKDVSNYNGIDKFKKGFGGYDKKLYNITVSNGCWGDLAIELMRWRKK